MKTASLCLVVAAILSRPVRADGSESYYVIVFGSQRPLLNHPAHTHSWATFVRVVEEPKRPETRTVEAHTVSWLAAAAVVRPLALFSEPGMNLDLRATLDWAMNDGQRVSMWGPYQIDQRLFEQALAKKECLESGEVLYKSDDLCRHTAAVSNCVHAVADVADGPRLRIAQPGWGDSASYFVALSYRPFMVDDQSTHDWLLDSLSLRDERIVHRDLDLNPTRNFALRAIQNIWRVRLRRGRFL